MGHARHAASSAATSTLTSSVATFHTTSKSISSSPWANRFRIPTPTPQGTSGMLARTVGETLVAASPIPLDPL